MSVDNITAFLFHRGGHADPVRLAANAGKSFVGSYVLGMGFTFDDTDKKGVASSLADMQRLIDSDPRNREVIFPYIGGEEVNTSPTHAHHRYVINFGERSEDECRRRWPDLMAIVEERVKPTRMTDNRATYRDHWWQYAEIAKGASHRHRRSEAGVSYLTESAHASIAFTYVPNGTILNEKTVVLPFDQHSRRSAVLQSRIHEIWARFFGSTLKDDLQLHTLELLRHLPVPRKLGDPSPTLKPPERSTMSTAPRSWSINTRA